MLRRESHDLTAAKSGTCDAVGVLSRCRQRRDVAQGRAQGREAVFKHHDVVVRRRNLRGVRGSGGADGALIGRGEMRPCLPVGCHSHPVS
ncbi:hypothetical protein PJL18_02266 [Paenarthrobacter nicotinovorans]|nr:hypothetical protein [Paenarthrobacter nicotinovorans]